MNLRFNLATIYAHNPQLFDLMSFPAGFDKQLFIDVLIDEYGGLGIAREIEQMANSCGIWSRRKFGTIAKLMQSVDVSYNPIENYDRYEEYTDTAISTSGSKGKSDMVGSSAGMDGTTMKDDTQSVNVSEASANGNSTTTHTAHIHGNIGVTTADQMLQGYRDSAMYDLYSQVANMFAVDLLIAIYY